MPHPTDHPSSSSPPRTVGLDLGDRKTHICVLDSAGEVVVETTASTTRPGLSGWLSRQPRSRVVLEASTHSRWVSQLASELGFEVVVANPRKVKLIFGDHRKNDRLDAERLARLGRVDPKLLHPIEHRSDTAQEGLVTLKAREGLVGARTKLINSARAMAKSFGERVPKCSAAHFPTKAAAHLPEALLCALQPLLDAITALSEQVALCDQRIDDLGRDVYPETAVLRQVPGVGPITSLAYVLTLEDTTRFASSRVVVAFLGLVPRQDQSSSIDKQLGITKAGDALLRKLLVQSAQYILGPFGPDCDLRRWGERRVEGGKSKRKVLVAVARRLAVLLHRLWSQGLAYDPLHAARRAAS